MREQLPQLFRSRVEQHFEATVIQGFDFGNLLHECQEEVSRAFLETTIGQATSESSSPNTNEALGQSPVIEGAVSDPERSSDFVSDVLQPPPLQLDSQMLDSSLESNIRGSGPVPNANRLSDSGYSSVGPCNCSGPCTCQGRATTSDEPTNMENLHPTLLPQNFNIGESPSAIPASSFQSSTFHFDQDLNSPNASEQQQSTGQNRQVLNAPLLPTTRSHEPWASNLEELLEPTAHFIYNYTPADDLYPSALGMRLPNDTGSSSVAAAVNLTDSNAGIAGMGRHSTDLWANDDGFFLDQLFDLSNVETQNDLFSAWESFDNTA